MNFCGAEVDILGAHRNVLLDGHECWASEKGEEGGSMLERMALFAVAWYSMVWYSGV